MARELRNVAASVHARLLRIAHERGEELQRLLVLSALAGGGRFSQECLPPGCWRPTRQKR